MLTIGTRRPWHIDLAIENFFTHTFFAKRDVFPLAIGCFERNGIAVVKLQQTGAAVIDTEDAVRKTAELAQEFSWSKLPAQVEFSSISCSRDDVGVEFFEEFRDPQRIRAIRRREVRPWIG